VFKQEDIVRIVFDLQNRFHGNDPFFN